MSAVPWWLSRNPQPSSLLILIFDPYRLNSLPSHWCPSRWCHRWWSSIVLWRWWSTLVPAVPWWSSRNPQPSSLLILIFDPHKRSPLPSHWCPSRWCHRWWSSIVLWRRWSTLVPAVSWWSSRNPQPSSLLILIFDPHRLNSLPSLTGVRRGGA